jgi:hypothetical protein
MGGEQTDDSKQLRLRVLDYLERMEDLCRRMHRGKLADDYNAAYEIVAVSLYGPLPSPWDTFVARKPLPVYPEEKPKTTPGWKKEMLSRPLRKVIATIERTESSLHGASLAVVYEILECRHENALYPGEQPGRRRRCKDCAAANRKKAQQAECPVRDVEDRRA